MSSSSRSAAQWGASGAAVGPGAVSRDDHGVVKDLESAFGKGLTGGGALLPMSDVIRLARHAHHYLAIFDRGNAIRLYHTKRLASPGQRIVLYAGAVGGSVGAPYRIVQMGTWPGAYSLPAQGVPQMCKCA